MKTNPFTGSWTYRSLLNDPNLATTFNDLDFGRGTIVINDADSDLLTGTIGGSGWSLDLHGSRTGRSNATTGSNRFDRELRIYKAIECDSKIKTRYRA